jgi:cell division transport system ATP-binding protein
MIEMKGVSVTYPNGTQALRDINCTINKGEFVFLVGPTGHGKSTFLRLIHRELIPAKGAVKVAGQDTRRLSPRQVAFLRRRVGMIFQDFRLLSARTLWENVAFALQVTGVSRRRIHRLAPELLRQVGLSHKVGSFPGQVSAGEQQRAAIARALVNSPAILLADEPTGNLDTDTGLGIMNLLADINFSGTTVICATHNLAIVEAFNRRVINLTQGKIVSDMLGGNHPSSASIGS